MCCNGISRILPSGEHKLEHTSDTVTSNAVASDTVVATHLPDGYWVHAFPFSKNSKFPDIIAYGLGFLDKPATIRLFTNPLNGSPGGWRVTEIAFLDFPVAMTYADLTGTGFNDIIICDRYGPTMNDLWDAQTQDGGRIQWLKNPGDRASQPFWEAKTIGNSTGMHRLQAGYFTTREVVQVMGLPIIARSGDLQSPAPILIYTPVYGPDKTKGPERWEQTTAFSTQFRLIHDVKLVPGTNGGLDTVLVAGREGVVFLWFDNQAKSWNHNVVGTGLPQGTGPYWGCGSADICSTGDDDVGYIATCEGFHGNTVAVYLKANDAPKGVESLKSSAYWTRKVIDQFGPLDEEQHTGTIHHVATVKIKTENKYGDSFAIACMGAPIGKAANQGVYLYTPSDHTNGFRKIKITGESAGRLAVAEYFEHDIVDIASISYYVPGYHVGPDPSSVRISTFGNGISAFSNRGLEISAIKLDKEVLIRIPRPTQVPPGVVPSLPFWGIAGKKLSLVVLSPTDSVRLESAVAIKVIYGSITVLDLEGSTVNRGIAPAVKSTSSTRIDPRNSVVAGKYGAVFLTVEPFGFEGPFCEMTQVSSVNLLPHTPWVPFPVTQMQFPFIKVEKLNWANSGLWDNFQFYNATGFHVYFNDDLLENVVHIQGWSLGIGETARFHNHSDRSFCEIHYCLTNGGGSGGMRYFSDSYTENIDPDEELTKDFVEQNSELLIVPDMHEHGPLWKVVPGTQATPRFRPNGTVDYPWHAWLASRFGDYTLPIIPPLDPEVQRFDVWMAFEFPPSAFQF